ncbi:MAG: ABC transporter permease, partial [candidate division Zixibacteria bacterium]|nr:ABC transporter permease [candidate division Zixibacteria bacterium]
SLYAGILLLLPIVAMAINSTSYTDNHVPQPHYNLQLPASSLVRSTLNLRSQYVALRLGRIEKEVARLQTAELKDSLQVRIARFRRDYRDMKRYNSTLSKFEGLLKRPRADSLSTHAQETFPRLDSLISALEPGNVKQNLQQLLQQVRTDYRDNQYFKKMLRAFDRQLTDGVTDISVWLSEKDPCGAVSSLHKQEDDLGGEGRRRFRVPDSDKEPQAGSLLLGTDEDGYDNLYLLLRGARTALLLGLLTSFWSLLFGVPTGLLLSGFWRSLSFPGRDGGFFGKLFAIFDRAATRGSFFAVNLLLSFPRYILILIVLSYGEITITSYAVAVAALNIPRISLIISSKFQEIKQSQFFQVARHLGVKRSSLILKHGLWSHCRRILLIQAIFCFSDAVMIETTMSYLNVGLKPDSWGFMLRHSVDALLLNRNIDIFGYWWLPFFPIVCLVVTIWALQLLGEGVNKWYESRG